MHVWVEEFTDVLMIWLERGEGRRDMLGDETLDQRGPESQRHGAREERGRLYRTWGRKRDTNGRHGRKQQRDVVEQIRHVHGSVRYGLNI